MMMKKLLLSLILCALFFNGCDQLVPVVETTGIALNNYELHFEVGGTSQLTAIVDPENATNKTVSWSS